MLMKNLASWKPFGRKVLIWAFFAPANGVPKTKKDCLLQCLVCTKYPGDHRKIKTTLHYKEQNGTSGLRQHCRANHLALWQRIEKEVQIPAKPGIFIGHPRAFFADAEDDPR
jgi:hypothetical protein